MKTWRSFTRELSRNSYLYLLALPGIIFLIIFAYLPMFGHLIAFKRFRAAQGIFGSAWAGFDNFKFFFGSDDWLRVTLNTLFLNLLFLTMELAVALLLAIFLNEIGSLLFKKLAQSLILMPYFISWLVVSIMTFALFNTTDGPINHQLQSMGIPEPAWYNEPAYWPALLTFIRTWKFAGYYSIIFLAATYRWFPYGWIWYPTLDRENALAPKDGLEWDQWAKDANNFTSDVFVGFNPDMTKVTDQMSQTGGIKSEYWKPLMYGAVDPEPTWAEYTTKAAALYDQIQAEIEKQAAEFRAKKG